MKLCFDPLVWGCPYAAGTAAKRKKKKEKIISTGYIYI